MKLLVEAVNVYKYVGAKQEIMKERVVYQFDWQGGGSLLDQGGSLLD